MLSGRQSHSNVVQVSCPGPSLVILSELDSETPMEVVKVLMFVSLGTFLLDPGPLWIIKAVQKMTIGWVHAVVSFSLRDGVIPLVGGSGMTLPQEVIFESFWVG